MTWDHWIAFLCFHADKYLLSSDYEAFIPKWKQKKCTCVQAYLVSSRSWLHNPTRAVPAFPVLWHLPSLLSGSRLAYAHQTPGDRAPVHETEKWAGRLESSSTWKMKAKSAKVSYIVIIFHHAFQNLFQIADLKEWNEVTIVTLSLIKQKNLKKDLWF